MVRLEKRAPCIFYSALNTLNCQSVAMFPLRIGHTVNKATCKSFPDLITLINKNYFYFKRTFLKDPVI